MGNRLTHRPSFLLLVGILLLLVAACSDDADTDGGASDGGEAASGATADPDGGDIDDPAGSVDDGDLLAGRDYLQGAWCDDEGTTYTVVDDTVELSDSTGAVLELPVDILFIARPGNEVISQSDDELVFSSDGEQITLTRGEC